MAGRIQITIQGVSNTVVGQPPWAVTAQFAVSALPSDATALATILSTIDTTLRASTPFKAGVGANMSYLGLHGIGYAVPSGTATIVADAGGTVAIAGTGPQGDPRTCVVVSERTAAAGPSYRGRSYWPYTANFTDGQIPTSNQTTVRASWKAAHDAMIAALSSAGISPVHVVWSPKTGNMTPINGYCTGNRTDHQKNRAGKGREVYVCGVLSFALAVTPDELSPTIAALDPDAQADIIARFNAGQLVGSDPLGPLGALWDSVATVLTLAP